MTRPKRTCTEPGCPTLVTKGYCLRHNRNRRLREARAPQQRDTMQHYDRRWKKMREIILARDPICKGCGRAPSTEVDHISPRRPDQHAADVTEEELQGLCKPCHSSKTRKEQNAFLDKATDRILEETEEFVIGLPCEANDRGERTSEPPPKSKRRRKSKDEKPESAPDEP